MVLFLFKISIISYPNNQVAKNNLSYGSVVKNPPSNARDPWVRKIPWRRKWQPTPVFLPEKSHGQRNVVGYSPWSCKESDTTEQLNNSNGLDIEKPAGCKPNIQQEK